MKKFFRYICLFSVLTAGALTWTSCNDDDSNSWKKYEEWRDLNEEYFDEQKYSVDAEGNPYYTTLVAQWNPGAQILIHYFNDRKLTAGNLSPMLTSTVDVKYRGTLYTGVGFDSSYYNTTYGDSIFRTRVCSAVEGWWIALCNMNVGDSARIILPYNVAYKSTGSGKIPPFSTLIFDIKLVDIPYYEVDN